MLKSMPEKTNRTKTVQRTENRAVQFSWKCCLQQSVPPPPEFSRSTAMLRRRLEHAAKRPRTRAALRAANNIMAVLTDDLLVSVAAHLSIRDLGRLSCVCRPLGPLIEVAARLLLAGKPPPARDLTPRQPGEAWLRTLWRLEAQLQVRERGSNDHLQPHPS
jgi:hypothetical protein